MTHYPTQETVTRAIYDACKAQRDHWKEQSDIKDRVIAELRRKLESHLKAYRDLNEALNMGDGSYRP